MKKKMVSGLFFYMKRVFIAINLPQEIKDDLAQIINKLKRENNRAHKIMPNKKQGLENRFC